MTFLECFHGEKMAEGYFSFQLDETINGAFGGTNGGVLSALCVHVARDLAPGRIPSALDTRFIRGFKPGEAIVKGEVLHSGRCLSVINVDIFNAEGKFFVRSTVTLLAETTLADVEHETELSDVSGFLPLDEGKVWPQPPASKSGRINRIPLIDTFQPAYIGKNADGIATVVNVIWDEPNTSAEAVCIAADISVGPPVAKLVKGKASIPNPDISLRFSGDFEVSEKLLAFCKTDNIRQGIASNIIKVRVGQYLAAIWVSTTTCIQLPNRSDSPYTPPQVFMLPKATPACFF